tara:strand:- start:465 stop:1067 length:603 start_codon:yes stop_codon:yes gene_type:complete
MIQFKNLKNKHPFAKLKEIYDVAVSFEQKSIEAMALSTFDQTILEVNSRYVNAKFIDEDKIIFFSNYESVKAKDINSNNTVSCLFYWDSVRVQIRIKGIITMCDPSFSDDYFKNRDQKKNALAISSNQSKKIESYEDVIKKYNNILNKDKNFLETRPAYWGGYMIEASYIEFWEGNNQRLNKREAFNLVNEVWHKSILEP